MAGGRVLAMAHRTLVVVYVLALAVAGGVFNRQRGSGSPLFAGDSPSLSYWDTHFLGRGVMAVPTSALVAVLLRRPLVAVAVMVLMWASLMVGWGTYFGLAVNHSFTSRIGIYDWMLGREQPGWPFWHRWMRDYVAMTLRGLVWTMPPGYLLWACGSGWQFAVVGALMSTVYSIGQHLAYTVDGAPTFVFAAGVPISETLWGTVIWLSLICMGLSRSSQPLRRSKTVEIGVFVFNTISLASCCYYGTIVQCDKRNWKQTFGGLLVNTIALFLFQLARLCFLHRSPPHAVASTNFASSPTPSWLDSPSRSINQPVTTDIFGSSTDDSSAPVSPDRTRFGFNGSLVSTGSAEGDEHANRAAAGSGKNNSTVFGFGSLLDDSDDESSYGQSDNTQYGFGSLVGESTPAHNRSVTRDYDNDYNDYSRPSSPLLMPNYSAASIESRRQPLWDVAFPTGQAPFAQLQNVIGALSLANLLLAGSFLVLVVCLSFQAERTCTNVVLTHGTGSATSECYSSSLLSSLGCSALASHGCVTVAASDLPPGCRLEG